MHFAFEVLFLLHLTYILLSLCSSHEAEHVQYNLTLFVSKNVLTCDVLMTNEIHSSYDQT